MAGSLPCDVPQYRRKVTRGDILSAGIKANFPFGEKILRSIPEKTEGNFVLPGSGFRLRLLALELAQRPGIDRRAESAARQERLTALPMTTSACRGGT